MTRPISKHLYGRQAPLNVSAFGLLVAFLLGSALALFLATCLLTLIWGAPTEVPLVAPGYTRLMGFAGILLLSPFLIVSRWRGPVIASMVLLLIFALAPLHSPTHFMRALVRAIRSGNSVLVLTVLTCLGIATGLMGYLCSTLLNLKRLPTSGMRGSTKWGTGAALAANKSGFLLGEAGGKMLRYAGSGHLMTMAATRSGKGVGTIIPNLLNHPGSLVVTDPKGENYLVTGRYRKETLGQEVVAMDPFGIAATNDSEDSVPVGFNPMDLIDLDGPDYVETAMIMAEMIIAKSSAIGNPHWVLEGRALLYAFILYAASNEDPSKRNLIEVRRLLTLHPREMREVLDAMIKSDVPQIAEGAGRIAQKADRERSGVLSTAQSYTHFLSSPRMREVLTRTDFSLDSLTNDKLSLYLILPREHLSAFAPWLRLMISCCYYACTHNILQRTPAKERILFLLDEFANLGYMSIIKEAVSLGGGFGISLWLILQDLAQLKRHYRDEWESFVANSDVLQAFAVQDPFTSERVTKLLGQTTVWKRRPDKSGRKRGRGLARDYEEDSRPLLRAEELRRLHPDRQLLLVRPYQPVVADKLRYYQNSSFKGRFDPNPYVT